jgi:trk system potassium uptake protein
MKKTGTFQEYAVIGLGRFGASVALTLTERGHRVLGIDQDRSLVQHYSELIAQTVALDATDEAALSAIDITSFDTVVVSMAEHFESSVLTTVALKSLGVQRVICKALSERQADILMRIGADRVVLPEKEAGEHLAMEIVSPSYIDSMVLGPGYTIAEITAPESLQGRTLMDGRLRERFGVNVLLIKNDDQVMISPPSDYTLKLNDLLVVIGTEASVNRFSNLP